MKEVEVGVGRLLVKPNTAVMLVLAGGICVLNSKEVGAHLYGIKKLGISS